MMDKTKRLKAIANKQAKQSELAEKFEATESRLSGQLEKFIADLDRLLGAGIHIENLSDLGSVYDAIEKFGVEADGLIDRLAQLLSSVPELEIPEQIELKYDRAIGDELKALKLELPDELTAKIAGLDTRLEKLANVLAVKQAPSKRVEDYQPVRIVVGPESDLRYLLDMPSSFGGGGSVMFNGLTDEQLRATPVPVSASIDTTGLATDSNQTNGDQKTQIVNGSNVPVDVRPVEQQVEEGDQALITHSVIQGRTTAHGGGYVDVKVNPSGSLAVGITQENYTTRIAVDSVNTNFTYVGTAAIGANPANAVWQIKRLDATSGLVKLWAEANDNFDNIWNNRESLVYS